jgi:putative ABC transport system substrate-binding protein
MNRRAAIKLLGGAAVAWPVAARAQQERMRRVCVLMGWPESDSEAQVRIEAFRDGLQKLRWFEGPQHPNRHSLGSTGRPRRNATISKRACGATA